MTGLVLENFGGMLPRLGEEALPATMASYAKNCRLLSGELQALKRPVPVESFELWEEIITRVYRVQIEDGGFYAAFEDSTVDFLKAPLVNDGWNRHYWTSENDVPRYATEDMLLADYLANDVPTGWRLGVPAPESELTVVVADPDAPVPVGAVFFARFDMAITLDMTLSAPNNMGGTVTPLEIVLRSSLLFGSEAGMEGGMDLHAPVTVETTPDLLEETRVYVYTFVSAYGEESAPSPPTIVTGSSLENYEWTLTGFETVEPPPAAERNIVEIRIYRTITGTLGAVQYYLVNAVSGEIEFLPLGTTTYVDTKTNEEVSMNPVLESQNWNPPPEKLVGVVSHPNGFLLAFSGRDLYMSVPYRPHAWPVEWVMSMRWKIVGLGIVGQSVVVLTEGAPQVAAGVRPEAMSLVKSDTPDPCRCRRGVVSTHIGVYYPGIDGLMLVGPGGQVVNLTKKLLTRREWNQQYQPNALHAVKHDTQYVAYYNATQGFAIDFEEQNQAFMPLDGDDWEHSSFQEDAISGRVWMMKDQVLHVWNPDGGVPVPYLWRSKEFVAPNPTNWGAYKITFRDVTASGVFDPAQLATMLEYNRLRMEAAPLAPINWAAFNDVHVLRTPDDIVVLPPDPPYEGEIPELLPLPQDKQTFHFGPLLMAFAPDLPADLTFRIYANREGTPYYEENVIDMELYRPHTPDFKAILWKFEIEGTADIQNVKIATTSKELQKL